MFTLVIGGAASGKSEYAEAHALSLPRRRVYQIGRASCRERV